MSYPKYLLVVAGNSNVEAYYVDGKCVYQGRTLDRYKFLDLALEHRFTNETLQSVELGDKDEARVDSKGQFPNSLMFMTDTPMPE